MANEIQFRHTATGDTLYTTIRNAVGSYWNGSAFATMVVSDWGTYDVVLSESPASSYLYKADFPASITTAGAYEIDVFDQSGGSPAVGDNQIANGEFAWSGSVEYTLQAAKLSSDGVDSISTTAPTGVASNFREMLIQTWRRLFKKSTLTSTQLKTYADNGSTVLTTQTVSDDGTTQTQGTSS